MNLLKRSTHVMLGICLAWFLSVAPSLLTTGHLPTFTAIAQQCSGVAGRTTTETRNHSEGTWVNTGITETRPVNRVFTLWRRVESWETWSVTKDTTGCPFSERILRRPSRTHEEWRGPVGY